MLHFLRRHKNNKVVWVALALIIGVFTFWGIGTSVNGPTVTTIATVNGRPVEAIDVQRAERSLLEAYRSALKDQFTPEMRKNLNLRQRALDSVVDREVLLAHAERLGMSVSDQQLRDEIAENPAFQVDGRFSKDAYLRAIRYAGFLPADFEESLRSELIVDRLTSSIADGVSLSAAAVREEILTKEQKVSVQYIKVKPSEFTTEVPVDDEKLQKFFTDHADRYQDPERVRIELIAYPADKFPGSAPSEEDVSDFYEANRATKYTQAPEVRARHILIKAPKDADEKTRGEARKKIEEIEKKVQGGADFAELATERSQDEGSAKQGGDLGFFGKGRMVKPFEDAAFALEPGQTSAIVESPFGFHLIRVEEKRDAREKTLDEVREEIVKSLTAESSKVAAQTAAAEDRATWAGGGDASQIAKARGLEVAQPAALARNEPIPGVGRSFPLMSELFTLEPGAVSNPADAGGTWVVARLAEKFPAKPKPFDAVKEQVETAYRLDEASKIAKDAAGKLLASAKEGGSLDAVAKKEKREIKTTDPFTRAGAYVPGVGGSAQVKEAAFRLSAAAPLPPEVYQVAGDWLVMAFAALDSPSDEAIAAQEKDVRKQMLDARRNGLLGRYLAELKKSAEISIDVQKLESMPVA